jgi:hypothetical protein
MRNRGILEKEHGQSRGDREQKPHMGPICSQRVAQLLIKEKLLTFHNRGWQVKDFGAFGAFEWGFIIIEIDEFQGYHHFKRDICSLVEQGLKYVYPEHIVCWL